MEKDTTLREKVARLLCEQNYGKDYWDSDITESEKNRWLQRADQILALFKPMGGAINEDALWDILVCFGENYGDVKLEDTDKYVEEGLNKIKSALSNKISGGKKYASKNI